MKWFKMQSDNLDDSFIQDLFAEYGATGYMVYFGVISLICKENKNKLTGKAEFSSSFIKQKLHVSPGKLQEILGFCQEKGKLFYSFSNKKFNLDFPKMLEIKDNYTKDLQVTTNNVSNHKEVDTKELDKEKDKLTMSEKDIFALGWGKKFEEIWATYPEKKGKPKAQSSFKAQVKNIGDWVNICKALRNYKDDMERIRANGHPDRDWMHGGTWFNKNWTDYINYESPKDREPKTWAEKYEEQNNAPF